jgi:pimeloyl-ACP methyl ester carboxylesterase
VAAAVSERTRVAGLLLVAPPLRVAALPAPAAVTGPIAIVVGAEDQYCPEAALEPLRDSLPHATITVIDGADHFFFGSLQTLTEAVGSWAAAIAA